MSTTTKGSPAVSATAGRVIAADDSQSKVLPGKGARITLAIARLSVGFIFLWAFLDKCFGLGFSTASEKAWIRGGTFTGLFSSIASPAADWLFMLGMLGVGLAVMLGIGTRVAAVSGSLIMFLMWLAEFPPIAGAEAGTNPLVDYHWAYALVLILVALLYGGDTWGLGKWWKSLSIVQKNRWLILNPRLTGAGPTVADRRSGRPRRRLRRAGGSPRGALVDRRADARAAPRGGGRPAQIGTKVPCSEGVDRGRDIRGGDTPRASVGSADRLDIVVAPWTKH